MRNWNPSPAELGYLLLSMGAFALIIILGFSYENSYTVLHSFSGGPRQSHGLTMETGVYCAQKELYNCGYHAWGCEDRHVYRCVGNAMIDEENP